MREFETKQHCFDYFLPKQKAEILDYALTCYEEIKRLRARIKLLESKCVMGGDGEPIGVGDMVAASAWINPPADKQIKVHATRVDATGSYLVLKGQGMYESCRFNKVSTPEAVPDGKE